MTASEWDEYFAGDYIDPEWVKKIRADLAACEKERDELKIAWQRTSLERDTVTLQRNIRAEKAENERDELREAMAISDEGRAAQVIMKTAISLGARVKELEEEARLNASMLAKQCDIARDAEVRVRVLEEALGDIASQLERPTQPMIADPYGYYARLIRKALAGKED